MLKAKFASRLYAFAASEKHVVLLADTWVAGTLVQVLVIFLATLTLKVSSVSYSVLWRIKNFELHLVYVARSRLVVPPVQALLVLALLVDQFLPIWSIAGGWALVLKFFGLIVAIPCFLDKRLAFLKKKHFDFANIFRIFETFIYFFLFKVTGVTLELLPCHWIFIEMVHLLHVEASRGVVVAWVAVSTLETNLVTLLLQVLSDALVGVPVIWSAKALILIASAVAWLGMSFQVSHTEYLKFLKSSTPMCNFYFVDYVL